MRYLVDEKEYALRDYQSKMGGQEKQVKLLEKERNELSRLISNKDKENDDIR